MESGGASGGELQLEVFENANGWGPPAAAAPSKFRNVPFTAFNKGDRLGRASDWYNTGYQKGSRGQRGKYDRRNNNATATADSGEVATDGSGESAFNFYMSGNEGFELVDYAGNPKPRYGGRRSHRNFYHPRRHTNSQARHKQNDRRWKKHNKPVRKKKRWTYYKPYQRVQARIRSPSVSIQSTWSLLEEIDFSRLSKLKVYLDSPVETVLQCGALHPYDKKYDRVNSRNDRPLEKSDVVVPKVTTSDDPNIRHLAEQGMANVFATDEILALIMACPRSVFPWDIIVDRVGDNIFFNKRDGSFFDYETVGETMVDPPDEDDREGINSAYSLSREATFINQVFPQQVLKNDATPAVQFEQPDPFATEEEVARKAYLYQQWELDEDITVIARCSLDGVMTSTTGKHEYVKVNALNEYDPKSGMDWRRTIDAQGGAVLAAELKRNANKLARWTAQAMLAGAHKIVFGFVSRVKPNDKYNHSVLGVQTYKTTEFAKQIGLRASNMWGIFKELVDKIRALPEGKYVLLRDPNKKAIKMFKVPKRDAQALENGGGSNANSNN